jgi:uncharacterized protein (DUF1330 family)
MLVAAAQDAKGNAQANRWSILQQLPKAYTPWSIHTQRGSNYEAKYTVVLSMIAGAAIGAVAIQGLHAQAKPKAYLVTESEIVDQAAFDSYVPGVTSAMPPAGGRFLAGPGVTKAIAVVGTAPQRFGIAEFDTVDQAQAWMKSPAREALAAQRNKAIKITRQFIVEGK